MNRRVYECMLCLCIIFLVVAYIIKLIFPTMFILTITNDKLLIIGNYIDTHEWAYCICALVFGFITYYVYTCACCRVNKLSMKGIVVVCIVTVCNYIAYNYTSFGIHFGVSAMLFLPALFKGTAGDIFLVYSLHGAFQCLSLNIRNISMLIDQINYAQYLIISLDAFIWLIILWLVQINNKEVGIWELVARRIMAKTSNFLSAKSKEQKM